MDSCINSKQNINTNYDEYLEEAYTLCTVNFSHANLISMLKHGNIAEKQIAALKFDYIQSNEDAVALLANLTGCDGKIREAVAQKINSLILTEPTARKYFTDISADVFADATIDINANICRLIIDSAIILKDNQKFAHQYTSTILKYTEQALCELDKFIFKDKKYLINKQLFKLYWCLEAIIYFQDYIESSKLKAILERCIAQQEYTIREKTAKIIIQSDKFPQLKSKLINDENYYVRAVFKSSMPL